MSKKGNIASVLAFEKKLVPSDGFMYGTTWENRNEATATPLVLKEKSVRGTISNRLKPAVKNNEEKLNTEVQKPNLQRVDSCALSPEQDTLKLYFTLKVLSGVQQPSACNNEQYLDSLTSSVQSYIDNHGLTELSQRYASNLGNARAAWRNRVGAQAIEVVVTEQGGQAQSWTFDALALNTKSFDDIDDNTASLSTRIADALSGKEDYLLLEVTTFIKIGFAQDVYPSEELVLDAGNSKSNKSKILYHINGTAGMHSQKLGNAIRTIDTWYPRFSDVRTGPIAVEPYGAVTNLGVAYRTPKEKSDFYTLFDKFALGESLDNINDEHFVIATLIRGGVFGASGKE